MSWFKRLFGRGSGAHEAGLMGRPTPAGPEEIPSIYHVELLFDQTPRWDPDAVLQAIREHCPSVEAIHEHSDAETMLFAFPEYPVQLKDAVIPAQIAILPTAKPLVRTDAMTADLEQSWSFPDAKVVVGRCHFTMMLTDLMSSPLEPPVRLGLFQAALAGIIEAIPATAIHWRTTGQYIDPARFLAAYHEGGSARFFHGGLNVRFYQISNSPGDIVMDTLGLASLGLPDIQCHYRDLDNREVSAVLGNTAHYLFEHGDVIADGHTVEGTTAGSKWRCQHEDALLAPKRVVLDLDPGPPHAAGGRGR